MTNKNEEPETRGAGRLTDKVKVTAFHEVPVSSTCVEVIVERGQESLHTVLADNPVTIVLPSLLPVLSSHQLHAELCWDFAI